jgi:hypothetical protein
MLACLPMSEVLQQGTTVRIESVKVKQAAAIAPSTRTIANDQYALVGSCFLGHDNKGSKRAQAFCDWPKAVPLSPQRPRSSAIPPSRARKQASSDAASQLIRSDPQPPSHQNACLGQS